MDRADRKNYYIMDRRTIQECSSMLSNVRSSVFCMCYWGRKSEKELTKIGLRIDYSNVLTPFPVNKVNSFLGFNLDILTEPYSGKNDREYDAVGVLWGKSQSYIDKELVRFLCSHGVRFYSVTEEGMGLENVEDLGILQRNNWFRLLRSARFLLGFGRPRYGSTILEALYCRTPIITKASQVPSSMRNFENIHITDGMGRNQILDMVFDTVWEEPNREEMAVLSSRAYLDRVRSMFNL